jgi:hypothetical protein
MKALIFSWRKLGDRGKGERGVREGRVGPQVVEFPISSVLLPRYVSWANGDLEKRWSTSCHFSNCAELVCGFRVFQIVKERVRPGCTAVYSYVYQEGGRNSSRVFRTVVKFQDGVSTKSTKDAKKERLLGRQAFCVGGEEGEDGLGDGRRNLSSGQKVLLNGVCWAGI